MARKFWTMRAAADDPGVGELLLYGPLSETSWWGDEVTPRQFNDDLAALGDIKNLNVRINSPGGDVFAGQAIHTILKRHAARVTVHVDGLAASSASLVAMAGDTVVMPRNAMMMIHNPWTIGMGDAREFRKLADTLDQVRESMIAAYQDKTSLDHASLVRLLNAETWLTAEEAVQQGFADEIEQSQQVAASLVRPGVLAMNGLELDVSHYRNVPDFAALLRDAGAKAKPTKRDAERALRDAGFTREAAKALVARGWADEARDAPDASSEDDPKSGDDETAEAALLAYQEFVTITARRLGVNA